MLVYYKLSEKFRKLLKRIRRSEHLKKIRKSEGGTRETGPGSDVSEAKTGETKAKTGAAEAQTGEAEAKTGAFVVKTGATPEKPRIKEEEIVIVVPVYNMILTPDSTMFLQTEQLKKNAGQKGGPTVGERVIFVVAKNNETHTDFSEDSFYPVGLSGTIRDINQNGFCVIRTQYRVNIQDVSINTDHSIELSLSRRNEIQDLDPDVEEEKLKNILEEMQKFAEGFEWADSMKFWMDQIDSIGTAAAVCSPWMRLPNEERYAILEEDSREKRTELLKKMFAELPLLSREELERKGENGYRYSQEHLTRSVNLQRLVNVITGNV